MKPVRESRKRDDTYGECEVGSLNVSLFFYTIQAITLAARTCSHDAINIFLIFIAFNLYT